MTWLVLDASSQDDSLIGTRYLHYLSGLSAGQVTVAVPGGQPIASQLFSPGTGENGVGVFDGIYAVTVPAAVTMATLTVASAALRVTVAWSGSTPVTVTAHGQATFPITFPAIYQPPPQEPVAPDAQQSALTPTAAGGSSSTTPVPVVPVAVVLAVAIAAAAAVYICNRRGALAPAGRDHALYRPFEPLATAPPPWPAPAWPPPQSPRLDSSIPRPPPTELEDFCPSTDATARPPVQLAAIPTKPPEPPPGSLYVEVLGPLSVTGWPDGQAPTTPLVELAVYLTLHSDQPITAEDLRDPLSAGRAKALGADTIRTYANTLRRILGPERVPDAARRGYTVDGAGSDWQQFVAHRSDAKVDAPPAMVATALVSALVLVRGRPYSGLPRSGYSWVATELLISEAEVAVTDTAQRLVDLAMTAEDWNLATWAAERGLIVDPLSEDLNTALLRCAAATGKPDHAGAGLKPFYFAPAPAAGTQQLPGYDVVLVGQHRCRAGRPDRDDDDSQ